MTLLSVIGLQWGDEGKGKVVDYYASRFKWVARYQGGSNAGHTVVLGTDRFALHHIPSGVFHPRVKSFIGPGVLVDPFVCANEIRTLQQKGLLKDPNALLISDQCALILPFHRVLDIAREKARGSQSIGTTGRGVGPAQEDRVGRRAIKMKDLFQPNRLHQLLQAVAPEKNALFGYYGASERVDAEALCADLVRVAEELRPFVQDGRPLMEEAISRGEMILFEGAQGVLLDLEMGTFPFVTSSRTTAVDVFAGVGVQNPVALDGVIGVTKAYATRVGGGPFPTEEKEAIGETLREVGKEYGTTTGRPRRSGWLDLVSLKYSVRLSGCTGLAVTKIDVLSHLPELRVCTAYQIGGKRVHEISHADSIQDATPCYETLPLWGGDLSAVRDWKDLPMEARRYLEMVEDFTKCPVVLVSVGPERTQVIEPIARSNPWGG